MHRRLHAALTFSVITFTMPTLPAIADPVKVVASFSIIGDLAKNVGGDRIELTTLVGPDGDAHVYETRPTDATIVSRADVILVNGLHFEGFLDRLVQASGTRATVAELAQGVETLDNTDQESEHGHAHEEHDHDHAHDDHQHEEHGHEEHRHSHEHGTHAGHDHGPVDPHAFQSVANARIYVKNVADAFCAADRSGCQTYRENAAAYTQKLDALETHIKNEIAAIPAEKRTVITSHDAFGYFAREYGIAFLAPEGISTEAEASAADVASLIRQIREDKAAAIFVENITNQRLIEQISNETGLEIGGTLYSDALSDAGGPAATYIDMMRHNVETIKGAVLGS